MDNILLLPNSLSAFELTFAKIGWCMCMYVRVTLKMCWENDVIAQRGMLMRNKTTCVCCQSTKQLSHAYIYIFPMERIPPLSRSKVQTHVSYTCIRFKHWKNLNPVMLPVYSPIFLRNKVFVALNNYNSAYLCLLRFVILCAFLFSYKMRCSIIMSCCIMS